MLTIMIPQTYETIGVQRDLHTVSIPADIEEGVTSTRLLSYTILLRSLYRSKSANYKVGELTSR